MRLARSPWKFLGVAALAFGFTLPSAHGQPRGPGGPDREGREGDRVRDLEAELGKLKARMAELESTLRKAREGDRGPDTARRPEADRRPEGPRSFTPPKGPDFPPPKGPPKRPIGPPQGFGPPGSLSQESSRSHPVAPMPRASESRATEARPPMPPGPPWGRFAEGRRPMPSPEEFRNMMRSGFDRGRFSPPSRSSHEDAIRRIDQMIRELEELKHALARG